MLNKLDQWHALPVAGGYLDQPYTLMLDLNAVRSARDTAMAQKSTSDDHSQTYKDLAARAQALAAKGG